MMTLKNKNKNLLPKMIPGSVHQQFVKCGKSQCKCAKGELHGPYFYHFLRINGKRKKRYIPPTLVKEMQADCKLFREDQRQFREEIRRANEEFRLWAAEIIAEGREINRILGIKL